MTQVHLAMQVCDTQFYQVEHRVCGDDRTQLSLRSITSFVASVVQSHDIRLDHDYHIRFICDRASIKVKDLCEQLRSRHQGPRLHIDVVDLPAPGGISASIRACYIWMQDQGQDIVAQFQDDYIFFPEAIDDAVDMFYQAREQCNTDPVLSLYNFPDFFRHLYHNQSVPRVTVVGRRCYWVQLYDIACAFFTSHQQFSQHWDLYTDFFYLIDQRKTVESSWLENRSLNLMFTQRGVLGLQPMNNLCLHMQGHHELDPHIDWRKLWESIDVNNT